MKTPEEIKKGLAEAPHVKYVVDDQSRDDVHYERYGVAIGYILRDQIYIYITQLESRLAQVERERDALMYDYPIGMECHTCKHEKTDSLEYPCKDCIETTRSCYILRWEWRGVCPENSKEE